MICGGASDKIMSVTNSNFHAWSDTETKLKNWAMEPHDKADIIDE